MSPATVTPIRKPRAGDAGGKPDAPWQVVVLNDDHKTFEGVAHALAAMSSRRRLAQGMTLANRIHSTGRGDRLVGAKERAELYWSGYGARGLTMAPFERT